jgi:FAD/FMN-containing dehydrogenase
MLRGCGEGRAVAVETSHNTADATSFTPTPVVTPKPSPSGLLKVDSAATLVSKIVGADYVETSASSFVVRPGSVEEVCELVKCAAAEGWTIKPAGSMTWLPNAPAPNLIISMSRLNRIIEHEPADLIAVAESGVRLKTFNDTLETNGQWLPLDPPDDGRATLGGVVATGLGGAQQFAYGRPRGSVIGMKIVLADGCVVKSGGRVVKNVAGYDLCKLFTGSHGALGIITEVNFKLRPKPLREQTLVAAGSVDDLTVKAQRILDARLFPVALELISSAFARELGIDTDQTLLLLRFAGNDKGVQYQTRKALDELSKNETQLIRDDAEMWRKVAAVPVSEAAKFNWRASVLPATCSSLISKLGDTLGKDFYSGTWQLGLGDGRLCFIEHEERAPQSLGQVRQLLQSLGGRLIPESSTQIDVSTSILMTRIKDQLDPNRVFA